MIIQPQLTNNIYPKKTEIICNSCGCITEQTGARQKRCKPCSKKIANERAKTWRLEHIDDVRAKDRARLDPVKNREKAKEWAKNNPEKAKDQAKKTYANNKERAINRATVWNANNKQRRAEISRNSAKRIRELRPEKTKENKAKRRENPTVRINDAFSARMRISLRSKKNGDSWEKLVGYTLQNLIDHLSSKFIAGMCFENYGYWHIDHIYPVSRFNFSSTEDEEFKRCWSLNNLQPLWARDNISKGCRIPHHLGTKE